MIQRLFNLKTDQSQNHLEKEHIKLVNKYCFIISLIFLMNGVRDFIFNINPIIKYVFLFLFFIFFYIPFSNIKYNKNYIVIVYCILSFFCFYFSSQSGLASGLVLFYIPIISSLPFMFNDIEDKKKLIFVSLVILVQIIINFSTSFSMFTASYITPEIQKEIFIKTIIQILIITSVNTYFIYHKENLLRHYYDNFKFKDNENIILKEKIDNSISELIELVKNNDDDFLARFQKIYPEFYHKLMEKFPLLTISEIKLCAQLKLNFSSKEISNYSHLSPRTIQSRKYNLRKKLKLNSNVNLNIFMASL